MIKDIEGHPGFKACDDGTIIGKRGRPITGHADRCGYREVLFSENGKCTNYLAHRLIAKTFIPNPDNLDFAQGMTDKEISKIIECSRELVGRKIRNEGLR